MLGPTDGKARIDGRPVAPIAPGASEEAVNVSLSPRCPESEHPQVVESRHRVRSLGEIDALITSRGFPEMNRSWARFISLGGDMTSSTPESLLEERQVHCAPFGTSPGVLKAALLTTSVVGGLLYAGLFIEAIPIQSALLQWGARLLGVANMAFLSLYATTAVRRRALSNMEDRMAKELAYMLSLHDFRGEFESLERTQATDAALRSEGFTAQWDNPRWSMLYSRDGAGLRASPVSPCDLTMTALKAVMGSKDASQRKFTPGDFFSSLVKGKETINQILHLHRDAIAAIKAGTASCEVCKGTLKHIAALFLLDGSAGKQHVESTVKVLEGGLGQGEWKAHIWQRDPLVDLTHQEEFYSSASLRGVKAVGRGMKGRLGTFLYHWNRGITMLDISSAKGRVVRARLVAVTARSKDGRETPHVLVDGVEGTTAVPRDVIQRAIEDYCTAVGAHSVLYNAFAHNQVPKRFGRFISAQGVPLVRARIAALDLTERQYLDSFGAPLEPFEYALPKGHVVALQRTLTQDAIQFPPPSSTSLVMQSLRRNVLWIVSGQAVGLASFASFQVSPVAGAGMVVFGCGGLVANALFQRRSLHVKP